MNNYNCLKAKFKDIPIGSWFTNIIKGSKYHHYYMKTDSGYKVYENGHTEPINCVVMEGPRTGDLEGFDDDCEVYVGKI